MNANRRKIAFVLVALAVQCAAIGWLIWRYEDVVQNGIEVRFKCSAYDPSDPFRGRYLRLSVVEECTNLLARVDGQEWDTCYSHNEGLFAELEESADGQWFVSAVADVPQGDSGIWIRPKRVYVEHAVRRGDRLDGEAYDDFTKAYSQGFDAGSAVYERTSCTGRRGSVAEGSGAGWQRSGGSVSSEGRRDCHHRCGDRRKADRGDGERKTIRRQA